MADASTSLKIGEWMTGGHVGISSKAIAAATLGALPKSPDCTPRDSGDFGRCYRLLTLIPEAYEGLDRLAAWSAQWARLAAIWDGLSEDFAETPTNHRSISERIDAANNPRRLRSYRFVQNAEGLWDIEPSDAAASHIKLGDHITISFDPQV